VHTDPPTLMHGQESFRVDPMVARKRIALSNTSVPTNQNITK
jgi:hypothetical protein